MTKGLFCFSAAIWPEDYRQSQIIQGVKSLNFIFGIFLEEWEGESKNALLIHIWASLVAQLLKNPPAMQETWVRSLGWEYPLKMGTATHSSILAWRNPCTV